MGNCSILGNDPEAPGVRWVQPAEVMCRQTGTVKTSVAVLWLRIPVLYSIVSNCKKCVFYSFVIKKHINQYWVFLPYSSSEPSYLIVMFIFDDLLLKPENYWKKSDQNFCAYIICTCTSGLWAYLLYLGMLQLLLHSNFTSGLKGLFTPNSYFSPHL